VKSFVDFFKEDMKLKVDFAFLFFIHDSYYFLDISSLIVFFGVFLKIYEEIILQQK